MPCCVLAVHSHAGVQGLLVEPAEVQRRVRGEPATIDTHSHPTSNGSQTAARHTFSSKPKGCAALCCQHQACTPCQQCRPPPRPRAVRWCPCPALPHVQNLNSNAQHCGACDAPCAENQVCRAKDCQCDDRDNNVKQCPLGGEDSGVFVCAVSAGQGMALHARRAWCAHAANASVAGCRPCCKPQTWTDDGAGGPN